MGDETERADHVDVLRDKILVACRSSSSTVYWLDLRGERPLLLRARGEGNTFHDPYDDQWVPLSSVLSGPRLLDRDGRELPASDVDQTDLMPDVLRQGSRHCFAFREPDGLGVQDYWWLGRAVESLVVYDSFPPPGQRSRPDTQVDFTDSPEPTYPGKHA